MNLLHDQIGQIKKLCNQYKVKTLFAFGSVITNKFTEQSDIDLIVDFYSHDPFEYSENYFSLKLKLQELLKKEIDLIEQKAIKNPYIINEIDRTKIMLYG